jgi:hypothetical protein
VKLMFSIPLVLAAAGPLLAAEGDALQFNSNGLLVRPSSYREWVFLSSGFGMTYSLATNSTHEVDSKFDNVFVNPAAYQSFLKTGTWPDQTIFIIEIRASQSKGSINRGGRYQTELKSIEAEVKDEKRFSGKWAFFDFGTNSAPVSALPNSAKCYSCHRDHGALDNTFVQFYPTLLQIAKRHGTLRSEAEEKASASGHPGSGSAAQEK